MKHFRKLILAAVCVVSVGFFAFRNDERFFEIARNLDIYATLFKELNRYYVDEVNPNRLTKMSIDFSKETGIELAVHTCTQTNAEVPCWWGNGLCVARTALEPSTEDQ